MQAQGCHRGNEAYLALINRRPFLHQQPGTVPLAAQSCMVQSCVAILCTGTQQVREQLNAQCGQLASAQSSLPADPILTPNRPAPASSFPTGCKPHTIPHRRHQHTQQATGAGFFGSAEHRRVSAHARWHFTAGRGGWQHEPSFT